jgi:hypothetical protein
VPYRRHEDQIRSHTIKILGGVRLGFRLCQFNIGRRDDGQVRGFCYPSSSELFQFTS